MVSKPNVRVHNSCLPMPSVDQYVHAATRDNTRKSYRSAIEHFEAEWGGYLPTTADNIARYLAAYAPTLAISTLRHRLAALSQWHQSQGFTDPTKSSLVKKVLKGIQEVHPAQPQQAKVLALDTLEQVDVWLEGAIRRAIDSGDRPAHLQATRNRALILIGFWRGFRSDELSRLTIECIEVTKDKGMTLFLSRTKTTYQGTSFKVPALKRLCPVSAYCDWLDASELKSGPVFPNINRWGMVGRTPLHASSFIPILRRVLTQAGISDVAGYSGHSLRRGFANWAAAGGWDLKTMMDYVGWKDVRSAMRYIDAADPFAEHSLTKKPESLPILD